MAYHPYLLFFLFVALGVNCKAQPAKQVEQSSLPPAQRPKAIVIGASSGIGRATAKQLAQKGYDIGIAARRTELLESLGQEISDEYYADLKSSEESSSSQKTPPKVFIKSLDVTQAPDVHTKLDELIKEVGGLDVIVISVTAYSPNGTADKDTINIDLLGFYNVAHHIVKFFKQQRHGHLIGISSVDSVRGNSQDPVFSAAKAFVSTYLDGIRNYMSQNDIPIHITDVLPGWVDLEKVKFSDFPDTFWVIAAEQAAHDICQAIEDKTSRLFVPKRWRLLTLLWQILPDSIYNADWFPFRDVPATNRQSLS